VDKCELEAGQWLAIVGCGGLGQLATRYAKAMNLKVVCLDIDDHKLNMVKQNGADATFNPKTNPKFFKDVRKLTGRRGCHAAAVFSDSHAAYDTAKRALGFNGILMIVGLPETPLKFTSFEISMGLIRVRGAHQGAAREMKKAVDFTAEHHIIPDVEYRKLEEMPQMWELMLKGGPERRMVVLFGDQKSKL
jgi:D-arabinose 1-dehydrogenase-like Zn-dependent alcohol dehydrogenase